MKKFSKILCLVLVVVMMAGLCVVGTNAAFTDADKITYTEAVDTLTAIGVIDGMGDNTFAPAGTLTRAQACKIIAYLKGAESFTATSTFKDTKNHWASNYIAYCAAEGIVDGVGNGNFAPDATLTGSAWAKMLLCAMGYDATDAGMTGATWEVGVAKLVKARGLADGIAKFVGSDNCNRETACKLAYTALWLATPTYSGGTTTTINGVTVTTGKQYQGLNGQSLRAQNFPQLTMVTQNNNQQIVDNAGYPAYKLLYKGQPVGAQTYYYYDEMTVLTYTNKVLAKTVQADAKAAGYTLTAQDAAAVENASANGLTTTVYFNDGTYVTKYASNDEIVAAANITKSLPVAQTKTKGAYVTYTISGGNFAGNYNVYSTVVDPVADKDQAVIVGEVTGKAPVLVYSDAQGIVYICEMKTVTGAITAKKTANGATTVTLGGDTYGVSGLRTANAGALQVNSKLDVTYYVDRCGNLALAKNAAAAPVYFVLGYKVTNTLGEDNVIESVNYAYLADTTGTVKQFKVASGINDNNGLKNQLVVTGAPDADGVYTLSTTLGNDNSANGAVKGIVAKSTTLKGGVDNNNAWTPVANVYANEKTVFVFANFKAGTNTALLTTTVVTGISAVGSYGTTNSQLANAFYFDYNKDSIVDVVFVGDNVRANATAAKAYLTGNYDVVDVVNGTTTYEYEAYVNGELTTVTIKHTGNAKTAGLYDYTATSATLSTTTQIQNTEIDKVENVGGLLKLTAGNNAQVLSDKTIAADCPVYAINSTDKTVNAYTFGDITAMATSNAYVVYGVGAQANTVLAIYFTI